MASNNDEKSSPCDRFLLFTDDDVNRFLEAEKDKYTRRKTETEFCSFAGSDSCLRKGKQELQRLITIGISE